ncbi:short-chain dehydrogenase/reductase SDR family protein [Pseudohyphozyma bogoriensis]|nr:short-chain dehydrogenase/reductase SDR family protein [Pseudohyphozyma bogoriensis]
MGQPFSRFVANHFPRSPLNHTFNPPKSTYDPERDMPDMTGKVVIVTGGNTGIGYFTVNYLLMKNAKVYLAARTESKAKEAIAKLQDETGKEAIFLRLDLGDLDSPRRLTSPAGSGVMVPPTDLLTTQGYDLQFGTNVVGHYLLTTLLLPALKRVKEVTGRRARVLTTTSAGHELAPGKTGIIYEELKGGEVRDANIKKRGKIAAPWVLYGASKFGNVLMARILDRDHGNAIMSCVVHPGGLKSEIHRHEPGWQFRLHMALFFDVHMGSWTQLWGGTSPEGDDLSGKYLIPWARVGVADPRASNEETIAEMRTWLHDELKSYMSEL